MSKKIWHVGVKVRPNGLYHADIFKCSTEVLESTHGHLYNFCFGPYRTQRKAIQVAMYQNYVIDTPMLEEDVLAILAVENQYEVIPDDGFSDGGESYTEEELQIINKKG